MMSPDARIERSHKLFQQSAFDAKRLRCRGLFVLVACAMMALGWTAMLRAGSVASVHETEDTIFVREHLPGGRAMTKLMNVQFHAGRPKLTPDEEASIVSQTTHPPLQSSIRNSTAALMIIGYINRGGDAAENRRAAFRRAQLIVDLLRDKCGLAASAQAATLNIDELPRNERAGKERIVEIWVVNH